MKVSEFIHLLKQLPPDMKLCEEIVSTIRNWGKDLNATRKESEDLISLKAYTADMKADKQQSIEYWQNAWEEDREAAAALPTPSQPSTPAHYKLPRIG